MRVSQVVIAFALLTGCGQIIGVDDYAVGAHDGVDPAARPLPLLPAVPDSAHIKDCEACAASECTSERDACLGSERCVALLDCQGRCSDPSCVRRCRERNPESLLFADYSVCVFGWGAATWGAAPPPRCDARCGQNFDCARSFHWDPSDDARRSDIVVRFFDTSSLGYGALSTFADAKAAPCGTTVTGKLSGDEGCVGWVPVDGEGRAAFHRVSLNRAPILALEGLGNAIRVYYPDAIKVDVPVLSRAALDFTMPTLAGYDPEAAIVTFAGYDCLLNNAVMRVELETGDRFYWAQYGLPDSTVKTGYTGGFINVRADHLIQISSWIDALDVPVSRAAITTAPGWVTHVMLTPASAADAL